MDSYFILVLILLVLAVADLMVGVANDAVNFLNSAIGSKVASRRTIVITAAIGVFIGASFSSGMMEVARKGIFNPSFFTFDDVMVIFLAVMITDILLLDFFNTLGLPTSTTVSIVFELLGASVITGLLMMSTREVEGASSLIDLINHEKALQIIAGIFLSIGVAFTIGAFVQWISRLIFTFRLNNTQRLYGAPFAGVAITIIIYFLLIKGVKGASFATEGFKTAVAENTWNIILISLIAATIVSFILQRVFQINPLKVVVLLGTLALAMAFAGNDLVNFIGVPISGYMSYQMWSGSGVPAGEFLMNKMAGEVQTPPFLLYGAGLIMMLTLWFSAKARKVTDTQVKLSAQGAVEERFKPNALSRGIVNAANSFANFFTQSLGRRTRIVIDMRFRIAKVDEHDLPAFDLVRASVNLMVASILIAFASSLKLPLSTTYVSFMVAMGASLADRAWGAESAPYRVAGVFNVIGGWFLTALGAFTASGIVALCIYYGGNWVAIALFFVAMLVLAKTNLPRLFGKKAS